MQAGFRWWQQVVLLALGDPPSLRAGLCDPWIDCLPVCMNIQMYSAEAYILLLNGPTEAEAEAA